MEGNKLIAEYMGVYLITIDDIRANKNPHISSADGYTKEDLQYHTSWDWLMPVVQKCRLESRCEYDEDDNWNEIHWALEECNLDKIYNAVVEFINEYNQNN